jgi:hypothetical protein
MPAIRAEARTCESGPGAPAERDEMPLLDELPQHASPLIAALRGAYRSATAPSPEPRFSFSHDNAEA